MQTGIVVSMAAATSRITAMGGTLRPHPGTAQGRQGEGKQDVVPAAGLGVGVGHARDCKDLGGVVGEWPGRRSDSESGPGLLAADHQNGPRISLGSILGVGLQRVARSSRSRCRDVILAGCSAGLAVVSLIGGVSWVLADR